MTDCYYKVRQVLQSATIITKWDITPLITLNVFEIERKTNRRLIKPSLIENNSVEVKVMKHPH